MVSGRLIISRLPGRRHLHGLVRCFALSLPVFYRKSPSSNSCPAFSLSLSHQPPFSCTLWWNNYVLKTKFQFFSIHLSLRHDTVWICVGSGRHYNYLNGTKSTAFLTGIVASWGFFCPPLVQSIDRHYF